MRQHRGSMRLYVVKKPVADRRRAASVEGTQHGKSFESYFGRISVLNIVYMNVIVVKISECVNPASPAGSLQNGE
jgi:hypothetical protein